MNFLEIVTELAPDAVATVKVVTGPQPGETTTGRASIKSSDCTGPGLNPDHKSSL